MMILECEGLEQVDDLKGKEIIESFRSHLDKIAVLC